MDIGLVDTKVVAVEVPQAVRCQVETQIREACRQAEGLGLRVIWTYDTSPLVVSIMENGCGCNHE